MSLPIKTYWSGLAHAIFVMCKFITKHQVTLLAVTTAVSPTDVAAVASAFSSLNTFCTLFLKIHGLVDPNAPPSE